VFNFIIDKNMLKKTSIAIFAILFSMFSYAWFWDKEPEIYTNVNNQELQQLLRKGTTLVDIRRPEEWRQTGVIKGSKRMTFFTSRGGLDSNFLPKFKKFDKDKPIILICKTGNRTKIASNFIAKQLGYTKIYNVSNGIYGWLRKGLPVHK
jgi:rhodanese-related sulfurtransferase